MGGLVTVVLNIKLKGLSLQHDLPLYSIHNQTSDCTY